MPAERPGQRFRWLETARTKLQVARFPILLQPCLPVSQLQSILPLSGHEPADPIAPESESQRNAKSLRTILLPAQFREICVKLIVLLHQVQKCLKRTPVRSSGLPNSVSSMGPVKR